MKDVGNVEDVGNVGNVRNVRNVRNVEVEEDLKIWRCGDVEMWRFCNAFLCLFSINTITP
jgi:hypothetical protein